MFYRIFVFHGINIYLFLSIHKGLNPGFIGKIAISGIEIYFPDNFFFSEYFCICGVREVIQ